MRPNKLKENDEVKAIVIGKFQVKSKMNDEILRKIINSKQALNTIPILSNVSFGHQ